jgi:hypothetical protein
MLKREISGVGLLQAFAVVVFLVMIAGAIMFGGADRAQRGRRGGGTTVLGLHGLTRIGGDWTMSNSTEVGRSAVGRPENALPRRSVSVRR